MNYRFIILSIFVLLGVSFFSEKTFSQSIDWSELIDSNTGLPIGIEEQISIEQTPQIPKPGETVSVRITSYSSDLNKAKITWTQDGKVVLSQTGAVTNQFQAPDSGKSTTIVITIQKERGGVLTKKIVLNPADVDLIYEADTYAHPFFKGKRQFTSESNIKVIAVPNFIGSNGQKIPASNLVYTWSTNGTVQQQISGYGKSTFLTKGQLIERPLLVSVDVSAVNSTLSATQSIYLRSTTPELVIYENNPILGVVYEKAILGSFSLERPQVDFEGIPYFFSARTKDDFDLTYGWSINGVKITSKASSENYLLLQNNNNVEGVATVSATLSHVKNLLQTTQSRLELDFKKVENTTNENNIF